MADTAQGQEFFMRAISVLFAISVAFLVIKTVQVAGRIDRPPAPPAAVAVDQQLDSSVAALNAEFQRQWKLSGVKIAERADDLSILRRLSLSLFGTVPSLEDIRRFEADQQPHRIDRWVTGMLQDPRYSDYFAERLARSLVGVEGGPFIIFRRDRLTAWLAEQLREDASWSEMTKQLIAAEGLWTDSPSSNFITVARQDDETINVNKLAGRSVRTFLGQRIDCAQCHDHPFDPQWKQHHFEGLAAFFCQTAVTVGGVTDRRTGEDDKAVVYKVVDPGAEEDEARIVPEAVPFHSEWLPSDGGLRHRLADWITHQENRRFERAIANRVWGYMFGKPLHDPVDDLPHPSDGEQDALDLMGQEFRRRGDRLSVLIRIIALSEPFQLSSESVASQESEYLAQVDAWSVFPLVRLRPEQVIGSLFQAGHVRTIDQNSNLVARLQKFGNVNDFMNEYGDMGDDELLQQVGTIPQALLRMNGRFSSELSKAELLTAAGQIIAFSPDDESIVENSYLACLARRPSDEERTCFLDLLQAASKANTATEKLDAAAADSRTSPKPTREQIVQDLFWILFNSPEFSWNH
ncbi:MAG: DUF1549 domain-containing protein [Planctomycetota bacterium]|nr:MAG: DUF1549 domain-containing protein [Planctomycetota bacterium]